MAKRFTDSEKWRDPWFSDLAPKYKLFWLMMLDECDHAGIWKSNLRYAAFSIGESFDEKEVLDVFKDRVLVVSKELWFIEKFIKFQYPNGLNSNVKASKSAMDILLKYKLLDRVTKGFNNPSLSTMDMNTDIDMDTDTDKSKPEKSKIPTEDEFVKYLVEQLPLKVNPEWDAGRAERAARKRYETYISDGWKDGHGKAIKNWKTKAINAITHEKPWSYGKTTAPKASTWTNAI